MEIQDPVKTEVREGGRVLAVHFWRHERFLSSEGFFRVDRWDFGFFWISATIDFGGNTRQVPRVSWFLRRSRGALKAGWRRLSVTIHYGRGVT